jgi:HAD superfamily hydrolase (TIGR01549 family)
MRPWAILFDLDDTLVQTSALKLLRDARRWTEVFAQIDRTYLWPGTREMLRDVARMGRTGVVTMARRRYAERVLGYHELSIRVLVAHEDVTRRKPDPMPIVRAAALLGIPLPQSIYVGDQPWDILAASRAGAYGIGLDPRGMLASDPTAPLAAKIVADWAGVLGAVGEIVRGAP